MNRNTYLAFPLILFFLLLSACKSSQPAKPAESYKAINYKPTTSTVNIPLDIDIKDLEKSINSQLKGLIYEDNDLNDNDGDNLMLKVWKKENIILNMDGSVLSYQVPLKLWIKTGFKVEKFGVEVSDYREVDGAITLDFKTALDIDKNWNLKTNTRVVKHTWTQKPVLKLGFVDLPIKYIADRLLASNKKLLSETIDETIKESFNLKEYIADAWKMMHEPMEMSEDYKLWVRLAPENITMTPLFTKGNIIKSTISVRTISEVFMGAKPPKGKVTPLPPFALNRNPADDFSINLITEIPFKEAERMAKEYLLGETFASGKRSVTINDLSLYGQDGLLVVNTTMTGSYNGSIYVTGKPVYNTEKEQIEMDELDFELKTKNFLIKSANWLFHKGILNKMKSAMEFPMKEYIVDMKKMAEDQLKNNEIAEGMFLNGEVQDITIDDIQLTPNAIRVILNTKGKINLKVKGM